MAYDYEALGAQGFQDFSASLAAAVFGPSIVALGVGRDGGRDMYTRSNIAWSFDTAFRPRRSDEEVLVPEPVEAWQGYTVFQVKRKERISDRPQENAAWLWSEVRSELEKWVEPAKGRSETPDHLIFITNVPLSPTPDTGGRATIEDSLRKYVGALADASRDVDDAATITRVKRLQRLRKIKHIAIWDRHNLDALLSVHNGVRLAYKGLMTVADVLSALGDWTQVLSAGEVEDALRRHARSALLADGKLYLSEAGGDNASIQVQEVAIDLPVLRTPGEAIEDEPTRREQRESLLNVVLDHADRVLKPGVSAYKGPKHFVLTGDPGNGKSTMSRLLTQIFRSRFMKDSASLSSQHRTVLEATQQAVQTRFRRPPPSHPRWPVRIDLAEYAEERGHLLDDTLLRWITTKINASSDVGSITAKSMTRWQQEWPWFVVFDGLDEVTEPRVRATVIERIVSFVNEAEADGCDLFTLVTTRPVGYTERLDPGTFRTLSLAELTPKEAVAYGTSVTRVRLGEDAERLRIVLRKLHEVAESDSYTHLLKTPLQVLILTIILDGSAGGLPPDRFGLFWGYYTTIFNREKNKRTSLRPLLQEHGPQITKIHERVGFELQVRSESGDRSYAVLAQSELKSVIQKVLTEAGHKEDSLGGELQARIYQAATQRLVLLAPRVDGFGFDVRPLQELNAARHLTHGDFDSIEPLLRDTMASPHWRNTWVFAAGRIFAEQDHLISRMLDLLTTADAEASTRLGRIAPVGPRLALDLLKDGMARAWPAHEERLLTTGLNVLQEPHLPDLVEVTRLILRYADSGTRQRNSVADGFRDLLAGPAWTQEAMAKMQDLIPVLERQLRVRPSHQGLASVRKRPNARMAVSPPPDWDSFNEEVLTAPLSAAGEGLLAAAVQVVRDHARGEREVEWGKLAQALVDEDVATVLENALMHISPGAPELVASVRGIVLPDIHRRPALAA